MSKTANLILLAAKIFIGAVVLLFIIFLLPVLILFILLAKFMGKKTVYRNMSPGSYTFFGGRSPRNDSEKDPNRSYNSNMDDFERTQILDVDAKVIDDDNDDK